MIFKKIILKNFISHNETEIDFPLGVTVIVGENGAGKSSILDGLIFALFGDKVRGDTITDIIRWGTSSAEIILDFDMDSVEYEVKWTRTKRNVNAKLIRKDIGVIATHKDNVVNEIPKILKMDKETIINSIFIRQGEIASLIDADPKVRKNLIGKLIGLDKMEKSWELMKKVIEHFEEEKKDLKNRKSELDIEIKTKTKNIEKIKIEIDDLKNKITSLEKDFKLVNKQFKNIDEKLNELNKKKEIYNKLHTSIEVISGELSLIEKEIEDFKVSVAESKEAKEKMKELEKKIERIPLIEQYVEKFRKLNDENENLNDFTNEINEIQNIDKNLRKKFEEYKEYKSNIEVDLEIQDDLWQIKEIYSNLIYDLDSHFSQISEMKDELKKLIEKAKKVLTDITPQGKEDKINELEKRIKEIETKIRNLQESYGQKTGRIREIDEFLDLLKEKDICPVCKSKLTIDHRKKVTNELRDEKKRHIDELKKIQNELEGLNKSKSELNQKIKEVTEINVKRIIKLKKDIDKKSLESKKLYKKLQLIEVKLAKIKTNIEKDISDINVLIRKLSDDIQEIITKIGYEPTKPENELKRLREKENEYNNLKPIAGRYNELTQKLELKKSRKSILLSNLNDTNQNIKELGYNKEEHEKIGEERDKLLQKQIKIKTELNEKKELLEKRIEEMKELEIELKKYAADLKKIEKSLNKIEEFLNKLERVRGSFSRDGGQKLVRRVIAPIISEYAKTYVEHFNLDIMNIEISEDFDISIVKGGNEVSIKSMSGGEKVAIAIAIRLALAKTISGNLSSIIMDEPTIHLDDERRRELVDIMKDFLMDNRIVPQMIIISHFAGLEDVADTIYQVKKTNNVSRVELIT
ncbi:MAG: AAA family ATPase [Candidatus Helarchaeota archaeon]